MDIVEFWTICSANGIVLSKEQIRQIERYRDELVYWNEKVNLISRKDVENVLENHILHSLSVLKYVNLPLKSRCLDLGTGGGLPGIPVSIANPEARMLLVDSIGKKIKITDMLAKHTGNKYIKAMNARVEDLANKKEYNSYFDFVFARAVSDAEQIVRWTKNLLKQNGKIVLFKGGDLSEEIEKLKKSFPKIIIKEQIISLIGYDKFEKEEKKLLVCSFS
ncbi:MAG: 16S rRNA (guanine(527)-N(7))-methyltransferase RsmG [Ignavibacteria bacterium GWB2_35_12]|nr:MAG: 16S rRNA (guanine(527)-N(7))-methyltransferase RsmG [Ignavibacteria bacterium GWA2_35_8]OGU38336.1 MAG: 16S rRNA (guanine(527)-N(7))-methyltransferase RsmG [Ignavibacteria bacterium GWB2_35_12]OGU90698.1 MAG: 16S rRNA (guanine(527)-N(7))-methyltransferase RsmG [Ignavibacteria bacterium RIFOXYA2_FULL_35_10]OGV23429.1 MAG: 16S rRNA (guanine(527)-N(7))-methyltransferase RsmG [Ignavibacteria bacterium RIFOXYC2_FULL_35_21]